MARAKLQLRSGAATKMEREASVEATSEEREGKGGSGVRPDRQGKKLIAGHFPKATWGTLRDLGTKLDKNNQELLQEALDDLFAKYRHRGH